MSNRLETSWDYLHYKKNPKSSALYTQKDWNQTLMTKINMVSAETNKMTLSGGVKIIKINDNLLPLVQSFEYYDRKNKSLNSMKVIVDNDLPPNVIYTFVDESFDTKTSGKVIIINYYN